MPDFIRRAVRSFVQAFLGALITSGVLSGAAESGVVDWSLWKKAAVSCLAAGVVALITAVQNWLEDYAGAPALLKAHASSGENPVTRDPAIPNLEWPDDGQADLLYVLKCVALVLVIVALVIWLF